MKSLLWLLCLCTCIFGQPLWAQSSEVPGVNIYETSLAEYLDDASATMVIKARMSNYANELDKECDRLLSQVLSKCEGSTNLATALKHGHSATKAYAKAVGPAIESLGCYDFEHKRMVAGTSYGFRAMEFQATILWRQILTYTSVLYAPPGDGSPVFDITRCISTTQVGGMTPRSILRVISDSMEPPLTAERASAMRSHEERRGDLAISPNSSDLRLQ